MVRVHTDCAWLLPMPGRAVAKALQAMLRAAGMAEADVEVHVLRDGPMAVENAAHMGCVGPTNVLSFPFLSSDSLGSSQLDPASAPGTLLLSVDTLYRECLLYGQEPHEHMLRLLAHGLAHVLGHDHGSEMDALCEELVEVTRSLDLPARGTA